MFFCTALPMQHLHSQHLTREGCTRRVTCCSIQVPRVFGPFDRLMRRLGVTDAPTTEHYVAFLRELAIASGATSGQACALEPNELAAVLRVVALLAAAGRSDDSMTVASGGAGAGAGAATTQPLRRAVFIPSVAGRLVRSNTALFNDMPWLAPRLDPRLAVLAHPRLSREVALAVGVHRLSEVCVGGSAQLLPVARPPIPCRCSPPLLAFSDCHRGAGSWLCCAALTQRTTRGHAHGPGRCAVLQSLCTGPCTGPETRAGRSIAVLWWWWC